MNKIQLELSTEEFNILAEHILHPMMTGGTPFSENTRLKLMKKMFDIYKQVWDVAPTNEYYESYYKGKFEELENEQ